MDFKSHLINYLERTLGQLYQSTTRSSRVSLIHLSPPSNVVSGSRRCQWNTTRTASTWASLVRRFALFFPWLKDVNEFQIVSHPLMDCKLSWRQLRCKLGKSWNSLIGCWDLVIFVVKKLASDSSFRQFLQLRRRSPIHLRRLISPEFPRFQLLWNNAPPQTPAESRYSKRNSSTGTNREPLRNELLANRFASRARLSTMWERLWCTTLLCRLLLHDGSKNSPS